MNVNGSTHPDGEPLEGWTYTMEAGIIQETVEEENLSSHSSEHPQNSLKYHYYLGQMFRILASSYVSIFIVNWVDGWMLKVPYINNYTQFIYANTTTQNVTETMVLRYSPIMFLYQFIFLIMIFTETIILLNNFLYCFIRYPVTCLCQLSIIPFVYSLSSSIILFNNEYKEYYLEPSFIETEPNVLSRNTMYINGSIYVFPYPSFEDYEPQLLMERLLYRVGIQQWTICLMSLCMFTCIISYCGCLLKEKYEYNIERVLQNNLHLTRKQENENTIN